MSDTAKTSEESIAKWVAAYWGMRPDRLSCSFETAPLLFSDVQALLGEQRRVRQDAARALGIMESMAEHGYDITRIGQVDELLRGIAQRDEDKA